MKKEAYHVHAFAENKDQCLVLNRFGLHEEEVGEGEVEEGDGGDDCGEGYESHGGRILMSS